LALLRFLTGDVDGAKADLLASIALVPSFTQSLVKIASVHMEQGDPKQAFDCFEDAISHNPNDPDIYYHRGQGTFPLHRILSSFLQSLMMVPRSLVHHERIHTSRRELHQIHRTR